METFVAALLGTFIASGIFAFGLRRLVKESLHHVFRSERMELETELKATLTVQKSELEVWSKQQAELFSNLIQTRATVMSDLARAASLFRRAALGIGAPCDLLEIKGLYETYANLFYANPLLPRDVHTAAHDFRNAADVALAAHKVLAQGAQLAAPIAQSVDAAYDRLLEEVREVLLPDDDVELHQRSGVVSGARS